MDEPDEPTNPEAWFKTPGVCGSCVAWRPTENAPDASVAAGLCRLRPELRRVPASLGKCSKYQARGGFTYVPTKTTRSSSKKRKSSPVVIKRRNESGELEEVISARPRKSVSKPRSPKPSSEPISPDFVYTPPPPPSYRSFPPPDAPVPKEIDMGSIGGPIVAGIFRELLEEECGRRRREMASKFIRGGRVSAIDEADQQRKVSAQTFFGWLERLAKSMDALEEAVDTHPKLYEESEELLGQLRRMRGSLTTFNVVFADRHDYFSGKP